jgi:DNA processing protein
MINVNSSAVSEDILYEIAVTKIPNIGPVLAKNLVAYCGSAKAIFETSANDLAKIPGIGVNKVYEIKNNDALAQAEKELSYVSKNNITPLYFLDEKYPSRLKHFDYSPIMLYYRGDVNHLNAIKTVGIIGTRKPTERGKIFTEKLVEDLAKFNAVIISGLAYGVDGIAHKQAVKHNIPTIGVMGNGHQIVYPSEHKDVAKKMIENGGVLTEFGWETPPDRVNFPMRNRIIAALSDAVVVVESDISGGSIITAEFANEYNKDVFALPGRIDDPKSKGCNALIKKHKAYLIESADDLAYIMRWETNEEKRQTIQTSLFVDLDPLEQKIVDYIRHKKEVSIDELIQGLELPNSALAASLLNLEFKAILRSLPGKKFMLQ